MGLLPWRETWNYGAISEVHVGDSEQGSGEDTNDHGDEGDTFLRVDLRVSFALPRTEPTAVSGLGNTGRPESLWPAVTKAAPVVREPPPSCFTTGLPLPACV